MSRAGLNNLQLYVEFSGTDLGELLQAVKQALSWSLSLLGRTPDYLSQRLGRSAGWPRALDYICGTRGDGTAVRDHYLSMPPCQQLGLQHGVRTFTGAYVYISSNIAFHLHAVMHRRYFLHKLDGKTSLWCMLVEFLCPELGPELAPELKMLELSQAMRLGVYALTVLVRMFNAAPETQAIETLGSLQNWCKYGSLSEKWRAHGRGPAVFGHVSRGRPFRIPMWVQHGECTTVISREEIP